MKRQFQSAPVTWASEKEGLRKLALSANALLRGKTNNTFEVTLEVSPATTTVLSSSLITPDSEAFLQAKTATAAAAVGAGVIYTTIAAGVFTINHDASASADRTFAVLIVG